MLGLQAHHQSAGFSTVGRQQCTRAKALVAQVTLATTILAPVKTDRLDHLWTVTLPLVAQPRRIERECRGRRDV